MIRVKMVHHINVQITNRERTRAWYEQVLGAKFLDRGPALNKRQMQLNIGNAEMHFSETDTPVMAPQPHFALEVEDWPATLAHLDRLGVPYSVRAAAPSRPLAPAMKSAGPNVKIAASTIRTCTIPMATSSNWYIIRSGWWMRRASKSTSQRRLRACAGGSYPRWRQRLAKPLPQ